MAKLYTLRNIIALFVVFFLVSCSKQDNYQNSSTIEVKSISSEDKYSEVTKVGELKEAEYGQTVYVVQKK